jgi:aspartate kinase
MVVQKFGGTSVADAGAIERLIAIVRSARERDGAGPAVVVSAMSGVTDSLLSMAADARDGRLPAALDTLAALRNRHHLTADALVPERARGVLVAALDEHLAQLDAVVRAIASTGEASPRAMDVVAATGELLSSRLVAAALSAAGVPAHWVDARRAVVTSDDYTSARPDADATNAAMRSQVGAAVDRGEVPVLGGFVGAPADGHTTTLGRGGSDYSGALVGAGIGAREIQIWTDVDGMLSADPRVVNAPRLVPELSFAEAAELAYFGAKVLHPSTILPAVEHDIPVRILNSRRPDGTGTVITDAGAAHGTPVTALACKRNLTLIDVTSSRMLMAYGFLRQVFEVFERFRTAVDVVTTSEVSVSITVDDCRQLDPIVQALRALGEVSVEGEMALVCAVGDRLRTEPEIGARVVGLLEEFPLRMISQAAARRNITVVMRETHLREAMERLHQELFG